MRREWLIEEELIEWPDRFGGVPEYGREIRLVNPAGEVVGRRLVEPIRYGKLEYYVLFEGRRGYNWWNPSPESIVFVAELPPEVVRFWTGRSLMMYHHDYISPDRSIRGEWRLLERTAVGRTDSCIHYGCSRRIVERYEYTSGAGSSTVEWCVCLSSEPPLLGAEVPPCSELWWDGRLARRHILLHYRDASPQERAFFWVPRKAKRRWVEAKELFRTPLSGFAPPFLLDWQR